MAKNKKTGESKDVKRIRTLIILSIVLIVGVVVGYGLLYSTGVTDKIGADGYSEGRHYDLIEGVEPRRAGAPVVVTEYFSYGCIHCKNFEPLVKDFERTLPAGAKLEQVPVTFNASWSLLARAYLALASINGLTTNHERLFAAIHDSRRQFTSAEQIADFVAGKDGVTREAFLSAFNAPNVRRKLAKIDATMRTAQLASVPSLVVDGRYRINMSDIGRKQALEVARFLVERELAGGDPKAATEATSQPATQ